MFYAVTKMKTTWWWWCRVAMVTDCPVRSWAGLYVSIERWQMTITWHNFWLSTKKLLKADQKVHPTLVNSVIIHSNTPSWPNLRYCDTRGSRLVPMTHLNFSEIKKGTNNYRKTVNWHIKFCTNLLVSKQTSDKWQQICVFDIALV